MNTCYAVVFTDRWGVDNRAVEIWTDKEKAEERAKFLTDNYENKNDTNGKRNYYYEVDELPFNTIPIQE